MRTSEVCSSVWTVISFQWSILDEDIYGLVFCMNCDLFSVIHIRWWHLWFVLVCELWSLFTPSSKKTICDVCSSIYELCSLSLRLLGCRHLWFLLQYMNCVLFFKSTFSVQDGAICGLSYSVNCVLFHSCICSYLRTPEKSCGRAVEFLKAVVYLQSLISIIVYYDYDNYIEGLTPKLC